MSSLDRILPFLRPIEDLLLDPTVTEVMVNDGGRRVFVERDGTVESVPERTLETRNLTVAIKNIARACGDEISDVQPLLDARLEDGSRVAAMFPPCSVAGPVLTIRKFTRRYTLDDLIAVGSITPATAWCTTSWACRWSNAARSPRWSPRRCRPPRSGPIASASRRSWTPTGSSCGTDYQAFVGGASAPMLPRARMKNIEAEAPPTPQAAADSRGVRAMSRPAARSHRQRRSRGRHPPR